MNIRRVEERGKKCVASAAGVYLSVYLLKLVFSLLNSVFVVLFLSWLSKQTLSVKTQTGFYVLEIQLWNNLLGIYFKFCGLYNVLELPYLLNMQTTALSYPCNIRVSDNEVQSVQHAITLWWGNRFKRASHHHTHHWIKNVTTCNSKLETIQPSLIFFFIMLFFLASFVFDECRIALSCTTLEYLTLIIRPCV